MTPSSQLAAASGELPAHDATWSTLRGIPLFCEAGDHVLGELIAANLVARIEVAARHHPRDPGRTSTGALCIVVSGQVSIGVFDRAALAERGPPPARRRARRAGRAR